MRRYRICWLSARVVWALQRNKKEEAWERLVLASEADPGNCAVRLVSSKGLNRK